MASFTWAGYGALMDRLRRLGDPDATPLMEAWEDVIADDNRTGVLAGLDKDGQPMVPVTYRPKLDRPARVSRRQKNGAVGRRGVFSGMGPMAAGLHNNLTSADYRRLTGPPLAPRGAASRVITNLFTGHGRDPGAGGSWFAVGAWAEVVSTRGVPFLMAHFTGAATGRKHRTKLPVRDLRGVRPRGQARALAALRRWAADLLRGT